jgi:hypothetical protein
MIQGFKKNHRLKQPSRLCPGWAVVPSARTDHKLTVNAMTRVRTIMTRKTTDATMRTKVTGDANRRKKKRKKKKGLSASCNFLQFEIFLTVKWCVDCHTRCKHGLELLGGSDQKRRAVIQQGIKNFSICSPSPYNNAARSFFWSLRSQPLIHKARAYLSSEMMFPNEKKTANKATCPVLRDRVD